MGFFTRLKIALRWNYRLEAAKFGLDAAAKSFLATVLLSTAAVIALVVCTFIFVFFPLWHFILSPLVTALIYTDRKIWDNLDERLKK